MKKHFTGIKTLSEAKDLYKKLAMANHPDKGGDTKMMQEINSEFEQVFQFLKYSSPVVTTETASSYRSEFYTANGWKGDRYDSSLHTTDLTAIFRNYLKMVYPTFKFRVYKTSYSSIHVALMEAPVDLFLNIDDVPMVDQWGSPSDHLKRAVEKKHVDFHGENKCLTEYGNKIMMDVRNFVNSYNRDDSDSQSDYFDRRFYENLSVGMWSKCFQVVEKTARITPTKESKSSRIA